jgi:hypothetical protein
VSSSRAQQNPVLKPMADFKKNVVFLCSVVSGLLVWYVYIAARNDQGVQVQFRNLFACCWVTHERKRD